MKLLKKLLIVMSIAIVCVCASGETGLANTNQETLPTDVDTASSGDALVGVEGSYAGDIKEAVKLVNKYRLEACKKGYPDPRDSDRKLTVSDYVPVKWSSDLEYIARIRAAEASVNFSHTRPNGSSCFSISAKNGITSYSEVLALGGVTSDGEVLPLEECTTICSSISLWYTEKSEWIYQTGATTGHYTSMINPDTTYIGMANFNGTGAGEFTNESWVSFGFDDDAQSNVTFDTTPMAAAKNVIQTIEVQKKDLSGLKSGISAKKYTVGKTGKLYLYYNYKGTKVRSLTNVKWTTNSKCVTVSRNGTIKAKKVGKYKVKFKYSGAKSGTLTVTLKIVPKSTSIKKIKKSKTSVKVCLKKTDGITGYQIRCWIGYPIQSSLGDYMYMEVKTINIPKKYTTKVIKKLNRKTRYMFDVRTYKKVNGKTYYSKWSKGVTVKTK